jgi:hypothetical protein
MQGPRLEISRINTIPESDWDLPQDTAYVRLGCVSCANSVCFSARARLGYFTGAEDTEVNQITSLAGATTKIHQGCTSNSFLEDCAQPCPNADDIAVTKAIINEEYGSTL